MIEAGGGQFIVLSRFFLQPRLISRVRAQIANVELVLCLRNLLQFSIIGDDNFQIPEALPRLIEIQLIT